MEEVTFFIQTVASGMAWDVIKSGTLRLTGKWLGERLDERNFPTKLSQSRLDALALELQNAPSYAKSEPSALAEYLKSHHILPIIEKNLQQQNNQINIIGEVSGVIVGGNVTGEIKNRCVATRLALKGAFQGF